jgi:putative ABC transport system ATP-binding protein
VVATLTGQVTEKDRQIRRLTDIIDSLGRPAQQSGGQQQWVAVGRVLIARPELVFADEPTGTLGSRADAALLAFLRDATRFLGQTIVMVTHDPVAAAHADRVVWSPTAASSTTSPRPPPTPCSPAWPALLGCPCDAA